MTADFGRTARDYAAHRKGFPQAFYDRLAERGIATQGQRVLDVGTGTGLVARALALRGCDVVGLDPADKLLDAARELDRQAGVDIEYVSGEAEAIACEENDFDGVTACQCRHLMDDPTQALVEIRRVIRPGGWLVLAHFDWLPEPGSVAEATEALILEHNPAWDMGGGDGRYPDYAALLERSGFGKIDVLELTDPTTYTHEAWRGRVRASKGVGAVLSEEAVAAFDAAHAAMLAERFPDDPLTVPHRVFATIGWSTKQPTRFAGMRMDE